MFNNNIERYNKSHKDILSSHFLFFLFYYCTKDGELRPDLLIQIFNYSYFCHLSIFTLKKQKKKIILLELVKGETHICF